MNFMRDHFEEQPASRIILAYTVRPSDVVLSDDGTEALVARAGFGDPLKLGFAILDGRMAAPWIFTFEGGRSVTVHPRTPVRIKGLGALASY